MTDRPSKHAAFAEAASTSWCLEALVEGGELRRFPIHSLPFQIGRRHGVELVLPADSVSKRHAEIYAEGDGLRLRDLGSTNGTFVNRVPVDDAPLREGDILHFADFEFRLARTGPEGAGTQLSEDRPTTVAIRRALPHRFVEGTRELKELLREGTLSVVFQPIFRLPEGEVAAYEALGRGRHPGLPQAPGELFHIAESIGVEAELSRLCRRKAIELVRHRHDLPTLFLNTHPVELSRPGLLESLEELRALAPQLELALEIHESVLTRPAVIAELRALLIERQIALAYDDFGAGQARLLELAEAPPHYLKFDKRFITGIDDATRPRRRLLTSLLALARDLGVHTVAEGIETAAEARVCREIGFTHAQGFYLGPPITVERL